MLPIATGAQGVLQMVNLVNVTVSVPEEHVGSVYAYVAELIPAGTQSTAEVEKVRHGSGNPRGVEPRQPPLAGEQFLHGALLDLALLGQQLLQRVDQGVSID